MRDDRSTASSSSVSIGRSATIVTLRTAPRAPMAQPRARRSSPIVAAAATGMSAMSASSSATRRATSRGEAHASSIRADAGEPSSAS